MAVVLEIRFNHIPRITNEMISRAQDAVAAATFDAEASAKAHAPVDTGNLRASIMSEAEGLEGAIYTGVEYAPFQEYGTHKMAAHPFFTPAIEGVHDSFMADMRDIFGG